MSTWPETLVTLAWQVLGYPSWWPSWKVPILNIYIYWLWFPLFLEIKVGESFRGLWMSSSDKGKERGHMYNTFSPLWVQEAYVVLIWNLIHSMSWTTILLWENPVYTSKKKDFLRKFRNIPAFNSRWVVFKWFQMSHDTNLIQVEAYCCSVLGNKTILSKDDFDWRLLGTLIPISFLPHTFPTYLFSLGLPQHPYHSSANVFKGPLL